MINKLQREVYTGLREYAALTQVELAAASGVSRKSIQRIEKGKKIPTPDEEEAIREAAGATRLFVAELVCKALSDEIDRRVAIRADDEIAYQAATPDAQIHELLLGASSKMPEDLWWAWKERIDRHKTQRLVSDQEAMADLRDLRLEIRALEQAREEGKKEAVAKTEETAEEAAAGEE